MEGIKMETMAHKQRKNRIRNRWAWAAALALPLLLVGLFQLLKSSQALMSGWVFGVMAPLEQALGRLCAVVPFSVGEILLALLLAGCLIWLIRAIALAVLHRAARPLIRRLLALAAVWLWLWAGVCWLWNAAYYVPSFAQRAGLEPEPYSVEQLAQVTEWFAEHAARLSTQVTRDGDGHFAEDRNECFDRARSVYDNLSREFPFLSLEFTRAKPLLCSRLQSALGFTGVYSPFTGEANVNVDAPACLLPATIAHEMSHQRMVAQEQEANFVGIAACVTSSDPVFQYSGYLMGLIHLCNALYSVSPDTWYSIADRWFTPELSQDWDDNNAYWDAFDSPASDAAETVYDGFLKSNDQELGIRSYGACVDLLVTYFGT